eukprot:Selendium_serpulae@DN4480_c1_g1_i2.p1
MSDSMSQSVALLSMSGSMSQSVSQSDRQSYSSLSLVDIRLCFRLVNLINSTTQCHAPSSIDSPFVSADRPALRGVFVGVRGSVRPLTVGCRLVFIAFVCGAGGIFRLKFSV